MCSLAQHFKSVTPTSFCADYKDQVFAATSRSRPASRQGGAPSTDATDIYHTLCLSVPVDSVLRHTEGAIKFFIVDTRPMAQFEAGHLPYAWHLDATMMMENPEAFQQEVKELESALASSLQHPCFLSSGEAGDEESLTMVVSQFLQKKQNYVSIVKGGFDALYTRLEQNGRVQEVLDGTAPDRKFKPETQEEVDAKAAKQKKTGTSFGWGAKMSKFGSALKESTSASYKNTTAKIALKIAESKAEAKKVADQKAAEKKAVEAAEPSAPKEQPAKKDKAESAPKAGGTSWWKEKSKGFADTLSKVAINMPTGRSGGGEKVYRGSERVMFSIDDDDDDDEPDIHAGGIGGGADLDLASAVIRRSSSNELFVDVALAKAQPSIKYYFQCSEVSTEGYLFPSHILLTSTHMIKLRDRNKARGEAVVLSRRELSRIQRITAKKKHPNIFTFLYDTENTARATEAAESASGAGAAVDTAGADQAAPAVTAEPTDEATGDLLGLSDAADATSAPATDSVAGDLLGLSNDPTTPTPTDAGAGDLLGLSLTTEESTAAASGDLMTDTPTPAVEPPAPVAATGDLLGGISTETPAPSATSGADDLLGLLGGTDTTTTETTTPDDPAAERTSSSEDANQPKDGTATTGAAEMEEVDSATAITAAETQEVDGAVDLNTSIVLAGMWHALVLQRDLPAGAFRVAKTRSYTHQRGCCAALATHTPAHSCLLWGLRAMHAPLYSIEGCVGAFGKRAVRHAIKGVLCWPQKRPHTAVYCGACAFIFHGGVTHCLDADTTHRYYFLTCSSSDVHIGACWLEGNSNTPAKTVPTSPSGAILSKELFMIPDCKTAKQAFKDIIAAIRPV